MPNLTVYLDPATFGALQKRARAEERPTRGEAAYLILQCLADRPPTLRNRWPTRPNSEAGR